MNNFLVGFLFGALLFLVAASLFPTGTRPYRQGQIDALSGILHYELIKLPNQETVWLYICHLLKQTPTFEHPVGDGEIAAAINDQRSRGNCAVISQCLGPGELS